MKNKEVPLTIGIYQQVSLSHRLTNMRISKLWILFSSIVCFKDPKLDISFTNSQQTNMMKYLPKICHQLIILRLGFRLITRQDCLQDNNHLTKMNQ